MRSETDQSAGIKPMFGRQALVRWEHKGTPGDAHMDAREGPDVDTPAIPRNKLDSPEAVAQHQRLLDHYHRELFYQSDNRQRMSDDEAFYDGRQWTEEEAAAVEARGQVAIVYNVTKTTIDWVLGSQRARPADFVALPRRKEGDSQARRKTKLLKYLGDVNDSALHMSTAYAEAAKSGLGWIECGVEVDGDGEPIFEGSESWRNVLHDSSSRQHDLSDARYLFRTRWVDADRALSLFADRADTIATAIQPVLGTTGSYFGHHDISGDDAMDAREEIHGSGIFHGSVRERVRLIEAWYRKPAEVNVVMGSDFHGEIADPKSPGHRAAVESGAAFLRKRMREVMHVAIMTETGLLWLGKSPYRHNRFPLTPVWCYRNAETGLPYGLIRNVYDIQRDLNKRASKAQWVLSNNRIMVEEGSVDDIEQLREEAARPDAVIVYKQGRRPPDMGTDIQMAQAHIELMSRGIEMIQQISGVTDEQMGRETNAASGKAIEARQAQGALVNGHLPQNLSHARQQHGAKMLGLIEQYMTQERQFRITGERGDADFVTINDDGPEDNHIGMSKADFVLKDRNASSTHRQAEMNLILEHLGKLGGAPELLMGILDLVIDSSDIPYREEIVRRIREMTGQPDPDRDPNQPPTEEELAKAQAKQEEQALMRRATLAEISATEAKAARDKASAGKAGADALYARARAVENQSQAEQRELETQRAAIEAAALLLQNAGIGPVADMLMAQANIRATPPMDQPAPAPAALPGPPGPAQPMPPAPMPMNGA